MNQSDKIFVAGHRGLVGSALVRRLLEDGYENLVLRTRRELDLENQPAVYEFFQEEKPAYVFFAAAKVGGILANTTYPADFIRENLAIQLNVIDAAYRAKTKKLLFLGSSCIYPKLAPQPIKEEYLLTGELEPTNEWYAIAKIAGIKLCQAYNAQFGTKYLSAMPTNLYGPNDNFDLHSSHVLPALLRKFHEAKMDNVGFVDVWGSGRPRREFLYIDDLADACVHLMCGYEGSEIVNIGTGEDIAIRELADLIADIVGFTGEINFDLAKPDGTPRKLLDVSRMNSMGWCAKVGLREGIERTYDWYLNSLRNSAVTYQVANHDAMKT